MSDGLASGVSQIGTYTPIQLYSGERPIHSSAGRAAPGYKFGQVNGRGQTFKFAIVAMVGGLLVPWNPTADSDVPNANASATVTFANAVPVAGDKVTVNGVDLVFRAAADVAADTDVAIGATLAATAANLAAVINANRNDFNVANGVTASAAGAVTTVKSPGTAGNAVTLARTAATGANVVVSAATLSGGTDSDAESGGARLPVGILPHALDTTATGYNDAVDTPYLDGGVFNFDALDVPAGTTMAEVQQAFLRTPIMVRDLY